MLETLIEWGNALEKGGPWFLVAVEGVIIVFIIRFALKRIDDYRAELRSVYEKKDAEKDGYESKLRAQEDKYREAMLNQTREHQDSLEIFVKQVREKEERNTLKLIELTETLAKAMTEGDSITAGHTQAMDRLANEISRNRNN